MFGSAWFKQKKYLFHDINYYYFSTGITLGCVPSVAGGSICGVLMDPETNRDLQSSSVTDFTDPKTVLGCRSEEYCCQPLNCLMWG
jgi:hypothetical protein